ncbi:MAG TPA: AI-2E family transporter [Thermoanaerobaculia bacterium]|nr:AI-2E family transporter [Thermoanaerobaculia bacterium]
MSEPGQQEQESREWRLAGTIFFAFVAFVLLYSTYVIIVPFLTPILLGAVLVTVTFPIYRRVRNRMHGRGARAALVMLVLLTFVVVLPAMLIILLLVQQANVLVVALKSGEATRALQKFHVADRLGWLRKYFPNFDPAALGPERVVLPIAQKAPAWIAEHGVAVVGGIAGIVIGLFLLLMSAYFFYVEGETIIQELYALSPLPRRYSRQFAGSFKGVIDATFRGQAITSLVQGLATAIGFAIAGVPGAILWGAVAVIALLLPVVGAAVVWAPALVYIFVSAAIGDHSHAAAIFSRPGASSSFLSLNMSSGPGR